MAISILQSLLDFHEPLLKEKCHQILILDSLQSIKINQFDQNRIFTDTDSKVSIQVVDNKQNYEGCQDIAQTKNCFQMHAVITDWGKSSYEDSSNNISKIGKQNKNDINNFKLQKELRYTKISSTDNDILDEKNMLSSSGSDDDLTFVKEAYVHQGISGADVIFHKNSVSSSSVNCQDEALDEEAESDDHKPPKIQEKIYIQEQRSFNMVEERRKDRDTKYDLLSGGSDNETKYMTDIMESEKMDSINGNSKDLDTEATDEKQDVEKTEKCLEMAYAEHQNYNQMLNTEIFSEFTLLPLSLSLSLLPMTESVFVEEKFKGYSLLDSLKSAVSCDKSRTWPDSSNYPRNIFASRQTNMSSIFVTDDIFSQTTDQLKQHENIFFLTDKKTCNLDIFSNSIDWNVFKISVSQKCESKDFFEMKHWNQEVYQDTERRCNYQNIANNGFIDDHDSQTDMSSYGTDMVDMFESDFEKCKDPEYFQNDKDLERKGRDDFCEGLIEQNSVEELSEKEDSLLEYVWDFEDSSNKQTDDCFWKEESIKTVDLFDTSDENSENNKGCNLYLSGNPPIRLHLVEARVHTRSGNGRKQNGNYGSSGAGSADAYSTIIYNYFQGNGNDSAQRGNGSGRQSGSSSGSGGNGNNNNNNNGGNSKKGAEQKDNTVHKRIKEKKAEKKTDSLGVRSYSPENQTLSPSLPPPVLDPRHLAERNSVEMARPFYNETSAEVLSPNVAAAASGQQEGALGLPEGVSDGQNSLCEEEEEEVSFQHAAMSVEQLCDIIGNSTRSYPSGSDTFATLNICLTRIVHDLSLAADDNEGAPFDNCSVCLVLSQLLIHLADPGHDGCMRSCDQCSQIFHLIMEHCIGCIANDRPKSRITQSDLCYKICKYSQWNIEQLCQSSNKLKGKMQKYCDKVLGSSLDMVPNRPSKVADSEGIGEIGETMFMEAPSTGISSTSLSLGGNIVATETGEPDQRPYFDHTNHTAAFGSIGADPDSHAKLSRKPSHPRKTPAIPQPIPEDSQPESDTSISDDTKSIIYQRMLRIYGSQHRYGSLQEGNVHDVEQFLSASDQPKGTPGIGEVVFSHPPQLKIVAGFWDKKREECERTHTCPYQHREEGVILAEYKDHFGILCTRYQKHHQWERVSHLGNGMSGKCHLAIDLKTNFKFCCKKIHLLRYTEEELTLWSEMKNPYVVKLYGAIRHGVKIYIFSEFIDGGSLAACIEEQKYLGRRLSHWSAINYFQQLLKVLAFLQKKNILHEDIKADNILLRRNSIYLAVTDFGTSRRLQDPKELKNKSPVGSPTHWSPEKASMEGHGFSSDLWAAVCVLVHMLSGEPPWVKRFMNRVAILNFIIFQRSPPMEDVPSNIQLVVRDLIAKGFIRDPQARPSSSELLQHPAFKILDEGTPETYFSTLTSMAHGFPVIQAAVGGVEQPTVRRDVTMFSTADSAAADATVLYAGTVKTGPYQESDSRPDNLNKQQSERIPEIINPNEVVRTVDQQQNEEDGNKTTVIDQSEIDKGVVRDEGQAAAAETQNEKLPNVPTMASSAAAGDKVSAAGGSVDSKVRQLVGPLDIDSLLPQFNELFVSGDSLSIQSIKSFFADAYNTEEFSGAKPSPLERFKPELKQDALPNLSIFYCEMAPATRQQDGVSESENFISDISQISALPGITNTPIRDRLQGRKPHSQNPISFMLSSESDECTSADLFEPDPAAKMSDSGHGNNINDAHAEASGPETPRPSMNPPEDMSPTASTGSSSNTSTLQMRKPTNLTLHCTPLPPELPHSHSDIPLLTAPSVHESEMKHRSNTWSQLPSTHNPHHTGGTPSSSQAASALKKTNGASIPSTASSGHSQFSYHRSSVKEEQEKRIQELT
ncbi:unnamed protein product, partial [Candidula unifasciata]